METRLPPKQKIVGSTPTGIVLLTTLTTYINFLFLFFYIYKSLTMTRLIFPLSMLILKARVAEWSKAAV